MCINSEPKADVMKIIHQKKVFGMININEVKLFFFLCGTCVVQDPGVEGCCFRALDG